MVLPNPGRGVFELAVQLELDDEEAASNDVDLTIVGTKPEIVKLRKEPPAEGMPANRRER